MGTDIEATYDTPVVWLVIHAINDSKTGQDRTFLVYVDKQMGEVVNIEER